MKIESNNKIRLEAQETFFDIYPETSYGFELLFYPGLSFFAFLKVGSNPIDRRLLIFPDEGWFNEWLEERKRQCPEIEIEIIFKTGKKESKES